MKKFILFLTVSILMQTLLPMDAMAQDGPDQKWGTSLTLGGKMGNHRDLGYTRIFAPLAQDEDQLIFGDLRFRTDPGTDWEGNAGLGYRFVTDDEWIVGMYGFFDMRESPADNMFKQITLGMEYLNVDWDFRFNAYIPDQSKKLVSQSSSVSVANNQVFIQNAQVKERALPGIDAEVGYRIPLLSDDFRLYAGGYHFESSESDDITGGRVRAQISFEGLKFLGEDTQIRFNAESQYDDVRKGNHFIGAEVVIPLYKTAKRKHLHPIEKRMTDPIVRDVDVVTGAREVVGTPEAAKATVNGSTADQVFIVSDTDGAAFNATVAALPSDSLIIVNNAAPVIINTTIALKQNQSVVGSSDPVVLHTSDGRSITLVAGSNGMPELVRSNAMFAGNQSLFTLAQDGNHTFKDIQFSNENSAVGGTEAMVSNGGNTPEKVMFDNVTSASGIVVDLTSGSSIVTVQNSRINGIDLKTRNDARMNVTLKNNVFDRQSNVAASFPQNITSSGFIESMNDSTMIVEEISGNIFRDLYAKIGGRAALGLGFVNSSTSTMTVKKLVNNEVYRTDALVWEGGAILSQATGGKRIDVQEIHDNNAHYGGDFEAVNTNVNIDKTGFTADGAGFAAANPGTGFGNYGGNNLTNVNP